MQLISTTANRSYAISSTLTIDHFSLKLLITSFTRCSVASLSERVCLQIIMWLKPATTCEPAYKTASYEAPTRCCVTSLKPFSTSSGNLLYTSLKFQPPAIVMLFFLAFLKIIYNVFLCVAKVITRLGKCHIITSRSLYINNLKNKLKN